MWQALYGLVRTSSERMKGYKRRRGDSETPGHAEWLKHRRLEVSKLAQQQHTSTIAAMRLTAERGRSAWQESHDKEEKWQRAQRQIRFLEASDQGLTPEHESSTVHALVSAYRAHNDKLRESRNRADSAKARQLSKPGPIPLFGCRVHVEKGVLDSSAVQMAFTKFHMRRTSVDVDTDMFAVSDMSNPGLLKTWCALFNGARLASSSFFESGGADGACFKYKQVFNIERVIWASSKFKSSYPALFRVLEHSARKPGSKIKVLMDAKEWASRAATNPANQARFIALVTAADKLNAPGIARMKYALTPSECVKMIGKTDESASRHGMCRR